MKKYIATLTQLDDSAPVVTVARNRYASDIAWTRFSVGKYRGTLQGVGQFTEGLTNCAATIGIADLGQPKIGSVLFCRTSDTEVELWCFANDDGVDTPQDYQNEYPMSLTIITP